MYLLDTNIWLERLLGQAQSDEVGDFLDHVPAHKIYLTDFAFHSICVVLARLKQESALLDFVADVFIDDGVTLASVRPEDTTQLVDFMHQFNLDFDDAYQYTVAEQHDLIIVSFDNDFNRTTRGKKTPAEIMAAP